MRILKAVLAGSLLLLVLGMASTAKASPSTFTVNDVVFSGSVSGTTAKLTVQCTVVSVCGNYYLGDVTLKGFTFTTESAGTASGGYTFANGGQNNKSTGTGGGCDGSSLPNAACWDAPGTLDKLGSTLFTFTATLTGGSTSGPLHVQATAYDNASGLNSPKHGDHLIFAISNDLTGSGSSTPEPASLLLMGTGLLAMGGMIRRKIGF